jgi:hypothetical protein
MIEKLDEGNRIMLNQDQVLEMKHTIKVNKTRNKRQKRLTELMRRRNIRKKCKVNRKLKKEVPADVLKEEKKNRINEFKETLR